MPLVNSNIILSMIRNYRAAHLGGRFGSGKTSLAYEIANELKEQGHIRYILSNVKSIWNDDPEKVELRFEDGGAFVDAVVILDEGGTFLETGFEAKQLLSFLRKLNIIILIPSRIPPSLKLRFLTVQRIFNMGVVGVPLWWYRMDLSDMKIKEKDYFGWWKPSEIYGIYDTQGMPMDDSYLKLYFDKWINRAAQKTGYERKAITFADANIQEFPLSNYPAFLQGGIGQANGMGKMESDGRLIAALEQVAETQAEVVSIYADQNSNKRRRKR